jgi:miniconductance mechanosensitive channel
MEGLTGRIMLWIMNLGLTEGTAMLLIRTGVVVTMLLLAVLIDKICRKTVVPLIRRITSRTEFKWDDYIFNDKVLNDLCSLIAPILAYALLPLIMPEDAFLNVVMRLCWVYIIIILMKLAYSVITSLYTMSTEDDKLKNHALKGFYQMLKLAVVCIGSIIIVSTLIDKNPIAILTGLGAGTAILMLVFQDTIKGFVAGVQLIANDMLRPGDWITMPKYGADGDVMEVTLTTVKVQNWDKTITTIPPYALVNDSFQNWRGMFDTGGRRIKRSINIDMNTVRFCTEDELAAFRKQPWMEGFEQTGKEEVNLYIFRHYIEYYLRHHPKVNSDMTLLVRQLQPTAQGMPVELYFFSANTAWVYYEQIQAEVFEHVLAMLHVFKLRAFQNPSGMDFHESTVI